MDIQEVWQLASRCPGQDDGIVVSPGVVDLFDRNVRVFRGVRRVKSLLCRLERKFPVNGKGERNLISRQDG